MKIASWNINSIRTRLDQLTDWLTAADIDVVGLQETKCEDAKFPYPDLKARGYESLFSGQKSYNGVAFLSKKPLQLHFDKSSLFQSEQKRLIVGQLDDLLLINVYIPNGQSIGSEKFLYKLEWLKSFVDFLKEVRGSFKKIIIMGDFNIAPTSLDYPKKSWIRDEIMTSEAEKAFFQQILAFGYTDSFRIFNHEAEQYSWWDYRIKAFEKNLGYRIDHILVSEDCKPLCVNCHIDKGPRMNERPSDHTPVVLEIREKE